MNVKIMIKNLVSRYENAGEIMGMRKASGTYITLKEEIRILFQAIFDDNNFSVTSFDVPGTDNEEIVVAAWFDVENAAVETIRIRY